MTRTNPARGPLALGPMALLLAGMTLVACGDAPSTESGSADAGTASPAAAPAQAAPASSPATEAPAGTPGGSEAAPTSTPANDAAAAKAPEPAEPKELKVVSSFAEGLVETSGSTPSDVPAPDPVLGAALVINGEVIPHHRVRKQVIFGERGRVALEMAKIATIMRQEIGRRIEQGADPAEFEVSDEEVEAAIAEQREEIRKEYPDDDIELEHVMPIATHGMKDRVAVTKLFKRVFLPDVSPEEFPPTTLEALHGNEQGEALLQTLTAEWQAKEEGQEPDTNPMFQSLLMQMLREHLLNTSNIEVGDHLPADVLMRINGEDVPLERIWAEVEPLVSIADVRSAKQWIVNMTLLEKELGDDWLSDEEAAVAYAEHSDPYRDSMFSMETIALMVKKYPQLRFYREFRHAYDSYRKRIADELTPEALKKFAEQRTLKLLGQVKVDVDVILCSAYDFRNKTWKEDGWRLAEERAKEVLRALTEEKRPWNEVQNEYSEFYDPPLPASYMGEAPEGKSKGRFRDQPRNGLMQVLEESEYWQFLNGQTVTDFIIFEQEEGTVAQPMRGPYGWYIPRLRARIPGPASMNLTEESVIIMAEQDYIMQSLVAFVQETVARNEVYGLE